MLKKTREGFLCDVLLAFCPRGHTRQVKKSCGQAYQIFPAPDMSKSVAGSKNSGGWSLNGKGAIKHTQSCLPEFVSVYVFVCDVICDIIYVL